MTLLDKIGLQNHSQVNLKKVGRKVKLAISPVSPDERLNTIADIIIERIVEEIRTGNPPLSNMNIETQEV